MNKLFHPLGSIAIGATLLFSTALPALAQNYPNKPIRLVVPFPPGGATDIAARVLAKSMSDKMGANVVVENKPGAGAVIGIDFVAKANPDGYTLLYGSDSLIISQLIRKSTPYKTEDFIPLVRVRHNSLYFAMNPKVPANNLKELVAYAKAHPGKLTYASGGNGTVLHFGAEMLKHKTGTYIVHIPYKGSAGAITDTVGGQTDIVVGGISEMMPFIRSGQLKPLGMTGLRPVPTAPMMPAFAQSGYPGFVVNNWNGVFVPKGTPPDVVRLLTDAIADIADSPEFFKALQPTGAEPNAMLKGEEFGAFIAKATRDFKAVVNDAKLSFD